MRDTNRDADDIERILADLDFLCRRHFARLGDESNAEQSSELIDKLGDLVLASRTARPRRRPLREIPGQVLDVAEPDSDKPRIIPERVTAARERSGMNIASLAKAAGSTIPTIRRIEQGAYDPALRLVVKIAVALGVEPQTLYAPPKT